MSYFILCHSFYQVDPLANPSIHATLHLIYKPCRYDTFPTSLKPHSQYHFNVTDCNISRYKQSEKPQEEHYDRGLVEL